MLTGKEKLYTSINPLKTRKNWLDSTAVTSQIFVTSRIPMSRLLCLTIHRPHGPCPVGFGAHITLVMLGQCCVRGRAK
jgi:hypothetical protein